MDRDKRSGRDDLIIGFRRWLVAWGACRAAVGRGRPRAPDDTLQDRDGSPGDRIFFFRRGHTAAGVTATRKSCRTVELDGFRSARKRQPPISLHVDAGF